MKLRSNFNNLFDKYNNIYIFDTETTGFNKHSDEIIEIGIICLSKSDNLINSKYYNYLIKQNGKSLPAVIVKLTNITDSMLNEFGIDRKQAAKNTLEIFGNSKILLIAHNANFDLNFLCSMLIKEGEELNWELIDIVDTLSIFKDRHEYPHKLSDAIITYQLENSVKNSHRAVDDSEATLLVFDSMCAENDDIEKYINIIGYNPKYPLLESDKFDKIKYIEQPYNPITKLYEIN